MSIKIFVSHAAKDEMLASALVDCLMSAMVLQDADLRCTSVPGHKLPVGSDFASTLLDDIGDSSAVIGLITNHALNSSWVLFELGATWGSKKNLKPVVSAEVDLASLPGPISGKHVAKLSSRSDVAQFLNELTTLVGAAPRTAAKIDKGIDDFIAAHKQHVEASTAPPPKSKIKTNVKETTFAGVPFSELVSILTKEKVKIPPQYRNGKGDTEVTLLDMFIGNAETLSDGLQSNWEKETVGGFMYRELGLRLLTYGLTQFEKLPAAQAKWFKRVGISPEGQKFLLQIKRALSSK
jgi:hypothetical protein